MWRWVHALDAALQRPWVRRLQLVVVVCWAALATVGAIALALSERDDRQALDRSTVAVRQATGVAAGLAHQTQNRTANVASWCGAIDKLDGSLTSYVDSFGPHVRRLHLTPLDCQALESKTLASTKPR